MPEPNHVLIIGGGIGGLCLAQGLRQAGIDATVYERDRAVTDRLQGYRVHISPKGSRALHDCLPPETFAAFAATCGRPPRGFRMMTERMRSLISTSAFGNETGDPVAQHRSVSRITLRQVLLSGLGDHVQFGKTFERYEAQGNRIVAWFEDGSSAEGDVLVAADGGGSRARRNTCRMRSASIPAWWASPARCSSTRQRAAASHRHCAIRWLWCRRRAAWACSSRRRTMPTRRR